MARRLPSTILVLVLSAFSVGADAGDAFPDLDGLRHNVEFWTRVFGEWSMGQVAFHDLDYPGIVYEVRVLPGPIQESYTEAQQDWAESVREDWEASLYGLEAKVEADAPLEGVDAQWVQYITDVVGRDKLKGAHERVRSQRGLRERYREGLERSFRLDGMIREIMAEHGLPEDLAYLPHVESSFQYRARSSVGATGLWQFTRGTGKQYMRINSAIDERLDPVAATRGAAQYLKDAHDKLGTWPLALTSYNHGVGGMLKAKKRFGDDFVRIYHEYDGRSFGFASKNFYAEFLAARRIARDPDHYFPEGYDPEPVFDMDSFVLERRLTPVWIASEYRIALDELAAINPAWSGRALSGGTRLPVGTEVWLPKGTLERASQRGVNGREAAYVVRRGDTLSEIATAHGMTLARLRDVNGMPHGSSLIRVGQELRVTAEREPDARHVVRRGDTLIEIASDYGVRLSDLLQKNSLTRHSVIHPGQVLAIPR
jgi:membrane-bound lytic murein transglycosylase D